MTIIRKRVKCRSGGDKKIGLGSRNIGQNEKKNPSQKGERIYQDNNPFQTGMPLNRCKFPVFVGNVKNDAILLCWSVIRWKV